MPEMPASAKAAVTHPLYTWLLRRLILPRTLQGWHPRGSGLEIGAGSAAASAALLAGDAGLRMTATDYDPELVEVAAAALGPFGERGTAVQADAADLPFADGTFDFVLSMAMLHHVGSWEAALAEAVRVLRPGGRVIGYDLLAAGPNRLMHSTDHGRTTLLHRGDLEAAFAALPLTDVRVRYARSRLTVRFSATRHG